MWLLNIGGGGVWLLKIGSGGGVWLLEIGRGRCVVVRDW